MRILVAAAAAALSFSSAHAAELIVNGGFETGDFFGWSALSENGSNGNIQVVANDGTTTPISGEPKAFNPSGGNFIALTDQGGPGAYALSQSFTLAKTQKVTVSFDLSATNWAGATYTGPLDYTGGAVEFARADILTGSADPFSTSASDIVSTLYGPSSDNGQPAPYQHYVETLSLDAGTYQIRFGEADNQGFYNLGVDNVSVLSAVPLPASAPMFGAALLALAGLGYAAKRKKGAAAV